MASSSKISPGVFSLEANILPLVIDQRQSPLVLIGLQIILAEGLAIQQFQVLLVGRFLLVILGYPLFELLVETVLPFVQVLRSASTTEGKKRLVERLVSLVH